MSIFYNDEKTPFTGSISSFNPNSQWANHSYNLFVLSHMSKTSTDRNERCQVEKEIIIADRKIKFWERHPDFDLTSALGYRKKFYKY